MMTPLATLVPDLRREAPGCRGVLLRDALLKASQDFCRRTQVWRRNIPDIEPNTGCTAIYLKADGTCLCGPTNSSAASLSDTMIWKDGAKICDDSGVKEPVPVGAHVISIISGDNLADCFSYEMGSAVLVVSTTVPLQGLQAVLMPTQDSVPDFVITTYREALRTGALFKLHSIRGQSWSDQGAREQNRVEFERYMLEAAASSAVDFVTGPRRIKNTGRRLADAP